MNRSQLVEILKEKTKHVSPDEANKIVDCILETMKNALLKNRRIEIRGFGSFSVNSRGSYMARNPKTGELVKVSARKTVNFKLGKLLYDKINEDPIT